MRAPRPLLAALVIVPALAAGAALGHALGGSGGEPVKREALAGSEHPRGAKDRTLGLSRVKIAPGGKIDLHHHKGTQVAYVDQGSLTYTVQKGGVKIQAGDFDDDARVVGEIEAGETGRIKAGQWIVEQPSTVHKAENRAGVNVVIYLATLLKTGAPPSSPVG